MLEVILYDIQKILHHKKQSKICLIAYKAVDPFMLGPLGDHLTEKPLKQILTTSQNLFRRQYFGNEAARLHLLRCTIACFMKQKTYVTIYYRFYALS